MNDLEEEHQRRNWVQIKAQNYGVSLGFLYQEMFKTIMIFNFWLLC